VTLALAPGVVPIWCSRSTGTPAPDSTVTSSAVTKFPSVVGTRVAIATKNSPFVAGEHSGAFWTLAGAAGGAAAMARTALIALRSPFGPQRRVFAHGGGGAHFFTDWDVRRRFSFLVIWFVQAGSTAWPRTRISDEA